MSDMMTSICDKPFTSYTEQVQLLQRKGLKIRDEEYAIRTLKKISYFALINGYKKIFKDKRTRQYREGVCFEDIVKLYEFDSDLRSWLLRYVLIVERKLKSLTSYHFSHRFENVPRFYLQKENYRYDLSFPQVEADVEELIEKIQEILSSYKYRYINHYNNRHHGDIPLWVVTCAMSFGKVSKLYDLCLPGVKKRVCDEYNYIYSTEHMTNILKVLTKFRNVCAHNERLYDYRTNDQLSHMPIHSKLNIRKVKDEYEYGIRDLFSVLISFRCLLDKDDFENCFKEMQTILERFRFDTNITKKGDVIIEMGFPKNWKEIIMVDNK